MQISLNIILEVLQSYKLEVHVRNEPLLSFSKCLPLPDETDELKHDCIYVGVLSKAMSLRGSYPGLSCICLRDRIKDSFETDNSLLGLIIVNENITITTLFTLIQNRFFTIINWVQELNEALIHGATMQEIIDLCAPIIDNYIAISDSSLMLLAYSKHIPCDDPICTALVNNGYFPEETIQIFRKHDLFKVWELADGPYLDESLEVSIYPVYHKIFKFGNAYFAHVVLTCNRNPLTSSMLDLFAILMDVLSIYMSREWEDKNACNHIYDTLLSDLIEGNITSKSIIEERAQYVGIPLSGKFRLFQVVPNDSPNISIGKMLTEFSDLFPRFKFIRYQQRIVAINHFYSRDVDEQMRDICAMMETFLQKFNAVCGVSLMFSNLEDIPFAFRQSTLALKYINRLRGNDLCRNIQLSPKTETRIHFFNEQYFFCLIGESDANAELWFHSEYHDMLLQLYQYDQRHKSNNIQLLHVYLSYERNATESANALNMHRNNVTYHINRIQELLDVDLNAPLVRFMLLVSFFLLQLYGFDDT